MKNIFVVVLLMALLSTAQAQSRSYQALKDHFGGKEDVHSFTLSGFLVRAAVNMAAKDEELMRNLMKDIHHVRFIVIPKKEFQAQSLSVSGFKKYLQQDSFEEIMSVRDKGDDVNLFHRQDGNKKNRYFVLVEEEDEVVAIEMKGYIDPEMFKDGNNKVMLVK